ncbi:hypothetical protein Hanom_Chr00s010041g01744431 [Helianthus anomalus]
MDQFYQGPTRPGNMQQDQIMQDPVYQSPPPVKKVQIKVRQKWSVIDRLKDAMSAQTESYIRETCFGNYLDIKSRVCDSKLLVGVASLQENTPTPQLGIPYKLAGRTLMFTPKNYCLITGLEFGPTEWTPKDHEESFKRRMFNVKKRVNMAMVEEKFAVLGILDPDDQTRICLLMLLGLGFLGLQRTNVFDDRLIHLVDDLVVFRQYPWGNYFWENTVTNVYNMYIRQKKDTAGFSLTGFVWPFKMWIMEIFPEFRADPELFQVQTIPRFLGWGAGTKYQKQGVEKYLRNAIKKPEFQPLMCILPTDAEMRTEWFVTSSDYLDTQRQLYGLDTSSDVRSHMTAQVRPEELNEVYNKKFSV